MKKLTSDLSSYDSRNLKSSLRLVVWTIAWVGTMVIVDKAELYQWYSSPAISVLAIIINAALGLGMILTYIRYLGEMDDLQRKIQLDALALSVGVGLVGGFTLQLMAAARFIAEAEASDIILIITLTYIAATIIGRLRYR